MLLWIDGFEGYGTTDDAIPEPTGVVRRRYTELEDGSDLSRTKIIAGRQAGHALWLSDDNITTPVLTTDDTLIVGFGFKITDIADYGFLWLLNGSADFSVRIIGTELELRRDTTVLATTSGLGLVIDTWYWLELKVKCDNTTGTYELKIDESTVLSASGVDTQDGTLLYNRVQLGNSTVNLDVAFDDFFVCDSTGTANNDFLGNCVVSAIFPNNTGNSAQLTPSAGSNYACVDEVVIDDDTTYIESNTSTHKDLYAYEDTTAIGIKGVQINTCCKETDADSFGIKAVTRVSSIDYTDSEQTIGTSDYVDKTQIKEINPATSVAWVASEISNSEFGLEVA